MIVSDVIELLRVQQWLTTTGPHLFQWEHLDFSTWLVSEEFNFQLNLEDRKSVV